MSDDFMSSVIGRTVEEFGKEESAPSNLSVIQVFFFQMNEKKMPETESARWAARRLIAVWEQQAKPTLREQNVNRIKSLYKMYRDTQKRRSRGGEAFEKSLSTLKGLLGEVMDISSKVVAKRQNKGTAAVGGKMPRSSASTSTQTPDEYSGSDSASGSDPDDFSIETSDYKRELCLTLDRARMSSRDAFRVVTGVEKTAESDLRFSYSGLIRLRRQTRKDEAQQIRDSFNPDAPLTVQFDGLKIDPLVPGPGSVSVERLPVLVSGLDFEQLLGARIIENGTGKCQAFEPFQQIHLWGCIEKVKCTCTDTTASNTGIHKGAAIHLEKLLGRPLLYLACRHHALETIPKNLFQAFIEPSSGPDIGNLCKRFQREWRENLLDTSSFSPLTSDLEAKRVLTPDRTKAILEHAFETLETKPRSDYEYLLELAIIAVGGTPPGEVQFRPPMALSSARFMGRIIYCLQMYVFAQSGEFHIEQDLLERIRDFNIFVLTTYLKYWYAAAESVSAPRNDLQLLHDILSYAEISSEISENAVKTYRNHLWYLSSHCIGFSFFDPDVSIDTKRAMVQNLIETPKSEKRELRYIAQASENLKDATLDYFVNSQTWEFFEILGIDSSFVLADPTEWTSLQSYQLGEKIVRSVAVVNDAAERMVALCKTYNASITKKESDFQDLLLAMHKRRAEDEGDVARSIRHQFGITDE